jgi:bacterioferritin
MKGKASIIDTLNALLAAELTAMDVYLLYSAMCADWGYSKLAARLAHEFDDEKGHACRIIDRILFLEGAPNMAKRDAFDAGKDVRTMLEIALGLEHENARCLNAGIAQAVAESDNATREMLAGMLRDTEEDHILWLETQLRLIDRVGIENYLQEQM